MQTPSTETAQDLLRRGLALGLIDLAGGRPELRAAAAQAHAAHDGATHMLACCAQVLFIGLADDNYAGFEAATTVAVHADPAAQPDPASALLVDAGALVAGSFIALDAPELAPRAARIEAQLADPTLPPAVRCCAGLAVLGYQHTAMHLEAVLWLELAMRPLVDAAAVGTRLADEAAHLFGQALYQCEATARALALRQRHFAPGRALAPEVALKLELLDAQIALGTGDVDSGRAAMARAEPLLSPRAPRPAGWWHLLRSRLDLLDGRQRQALTHARVSLRLGTQSQMPERWMGVTVMQEGQVLMARGEYLAAVPFFERAGRAASGSQARFCVCLARLARALHHFDREEPEPALDHLAAGLAIARELPWMGFFRASPPAAARICAAAIEHGVEAEFAREVIAERGLLALRPDLQDWPWPIRVRVLGGLRIELQGRPLVFKGKVAKKPLELLLFVVASGGTDVPVAGAAFALWRELEGDKAHAALNVALHRLRKLLVRDDALLLEHGRLTLNPQLLWVDALAFEQAADALGLATSPPLPRAVRAAAERALALHGGAFLHDSDDEPWQATCRSRLASKFKRVLRMLAADAVAQGRAAAARALLERALEFDPLAEDVARELMRLLLDAGERAAALAVFERCREVIARQLGTEPTAATLELVRSLRPSIG